MHRGSTVHAPRPGQKPRALAVCDAVPDNACTPTDWSSWYLTDEDDVGESAEQGESIRLLLSVLSTLVKERGWTNVYLGSDQFFAWIPSEPLVRVSPDVYLLDDPPGPPLPKSFQTWLPGHGPPRWAVEVVSEDWRKDHNDAPLKYAQLGVQELVLFDPGATLGTERRGARAALQLYGRDADGVFVRRYAGEGPVWSEQIDAALIVVRDGASARLRVARDASGSDLVPSAEERANDAEARLRVLEEEIARLRRD